MSQPEKLVMKYFYCSNKSPDRIGEFLGWQPASSAAGSIRFAAKVIYKSISSWLNSSITCGQIFLVFHIQTNGREIELITFVTKPRKRWRHRDRERESYAERAVEIEQEG
jgi:hypothetical protein